MRGILEKLINENISIINFLPSTGINYSFPFLSRSYPSDHTYIAVQLELCTLLFFPKTWPFRSFLSRNHGKTIVVNFTRRWKFQPFTIGRRVTLVYELDGAIKPAYIKIHPIRNNEPRRYNREGSANKARSRREESRLMRVYLRPSPLLSAIHVNALSKRIDARPHKS